MNRITTSRTIVIDGVQHTTQFYCSSNDYLGKQADPLYCFTCKEFTLLIHGVNFNPEHPYLCKNDKTSHSGFNCKHDVVVWCPEHRVWEELK